MVITRGEFISIVDPPDDGEHLELPVEEPESINLEGFAEDEEMVPAAGEQDPAPVPPSPLEQALDLSARKNPTEFRLVIEVILEYPELMSGSYCTHT